MIAMSVSEHNGINVARFDAERAPVEFPQLARALEQPAVDKDALTVNFKQVLQSGHRPGS